MKVHILTLSFLLSVFFAQSQLSYAGKGKLNLGDGTTLSGDIQFKPAYPEEVEIKTDPDLTGKYKKYTTREVKSFEMDSMFFEPRLGKGGEVHIGNKPVFMEAITHYSTGLNIYAEHFQEKVKYATNVPLSRSEINTFYISVPGNAEEVYDLNSFKFIPRFDDKVSKIVAACPSLAEKIRKKEKGYFYNLMNQQKATDIWANIVVEYSDCINAK